MPELVPNGVDIPFDLREELSDGKVVFFCGAGISMPAGLPSFKGLARNVLDHSTKKDDVAVQKAFGNGEYDKVFDLLECPGDRSMLPKELRELVSTELDPNNDADLEAHKTILRLSKSSHGSIRLVTTNYDRLFDIAHKQLYPNESLAVDVCPRLPVPKYGSKAWNSIVHLHGALDDSQDLEYENLVLSSADFGRAYLVERWASRFVTELFRNFRVVFIGYRVEDPVMKYLVDALAQTSAGSFNSAYAFVAYNEEQKREIQSQWEMKGNITPLLYQSKNHNHQLLWDSLIAWADLAEGGFESKQMIVRNMATRSPDNCSQAEISNFIWAVGEDSGNMARVFSRLGTNQNGNTDPDQSSGSSEGDAPDIKWLRIFQEHNLLRVFQNSDSDNLVGYKQENRNPVCFYLVEWLSRHLDKGEFLEWVLDYGTVVHEHHRSTFRQALNSQVDTIPIGLFKIWQIILSEDFVSRKSLKQTMHFDEIIVPEINQPYTIYSFINTLRPVIHFKKNILRNFYRAKSPDDDNNLEHQPSTYASIDIALVGDDALGSHVDVLEKSSTKDEVLLHIIQPITGHLLEVMDLFNYLDQANESCDLSYIHRPSISPHEQNRGYKSWTVLVDIIVMAIDACLKHDVDRLDEMVKLWSSLNYPIFKRLCLHSAVGGADE